MSSALIKVAVIGGGLAGTVLINALAKYPQLDVNLYEAKSEFQERGASVGLAVNARRALALLGLGDITQRAKGVEGVSFRMILCEGPHAGQTALDLEHPLITVHRASLLRELVSSIPHDKIHFNKKLMRINDKVIYFEDGSSATFDLIIGADGIHSNVRKFLFSENESAVDPVFSGLWDCRAIIPTEEAVQKLGTQRVDKENPRQHLYSARDSFFIHDLLDDGSYMCIIGGGRAPDGWEKGEWTKSVSREWLNDFYGHWGEFGQTMLDLLCKENEQTPVFLEWESAEAPKLYNNSMCLIGDAAHTTTPWQGNGFAQAVEDSLILSTTLRQCSNVNQISAALEAYDQLMRPRGRRVIESSRGTGLICVGADGFDPEVLTQRLPPRWRFIHEWDTEQAVKEAMKVFEQKNPSE